MAGPPSILLLGDGQGEYRTGEAMSADPPSHETQATESPRLLTLAEALELASSLHRTGKLEAAQTLYSRILQEMPECADALHLLGVLHHQTGRSRQALDLIHRAIELQPSAPAMRNNLGNILAEQNRFAEAVAAYRAAIALDAGNADAHNNLGVCLRALGEFRGAEASYRQAIASYPAFRDAHNNLGRLLVSIGRLDEAIVCHAKALELAPRRPDSRRFIVAAYVAARELDLALAIADQWVREEPESATAKHLLAAISGQDVPARASDGYIETAFDRFAASFDTKLAGLDYRAPELVAAAVAKVCGPPKADRVVLDAGCGTGLCGPLLAPYASDLRGVDLSSRMLEKAEQRGCYTALTRAELTQYMGDSPNRFDIIVSADTFCYFGALHEALSAATRALRRKGTLVFSVEAESTPAAFRLNPHGRYSHRRDYVAEALAAASLRLIAIEDAVLRTERFQPVPGLVVTAQRDA